MQANRLRFAAHGTSPSEVSPAEVASAAEVTTAEVAATQVASVAAATFVDDRRVAVTPAAKAASEQRTEQQAAEQPTATHPAVPPGAVAARIPDVRGLAVTIDGHGWLAVLTHPLQLGRRQRRLPPVDDRPGSVHRVAGFVNHPSHPHQIDGLVGVVDRRLRGPVPVQRGVEVGLCTGVQLDDRLEPHDVVGEHRQLGPQQLTIGRLGPLRLSLAAPRRPQQQCAANAGPADQQRRKHPAVAPTAVVPGRLLAGTLLSRPARRLGPDQLDEVDQHRSGVAAASVERLNGQLAGPPGWQLATAGPQALTGEHGDRAVTLQVRSQLTGQLTGVTTGSVNGRRRKHSDVDRRPRRPDGATDLARLGLGQRPLGGGVDVHRISAQSGGHIVDRRSLNDCRPAGSGEHREDGNDEATPHEATLSIAGGEHPRRSEAMQPGRSRHSDPHPASQHPCSTSSSPMPTAAGGGRFGGRSAPAPRRWAGGLLAELCANGRVEVLERLHRFTHHWQAAASLQLRAGDPRALDAHMPTTASSPTRSMITSSASPPPGSTITSSAAASPWWPRPTITWTRSTGPSTSPRATGTSTRCDAALRRRAAFVGDVVATRRNDRRLTTSGGEPVRNRDTWTVTGINDDGSITVSHREGHGAVTLPADYVHDHVRLGYAATEHGWQSDTVDTAFALTSPVTTRRGLYVAATRGRDYNILCVLTDSDDVAEARDVLDAILAVDRADVPATTQRRDLALSVPRQAAPDTPTLTPRCEIPDWFPDVLADAHRALRDAETREAQQAARRAQATSAAASADSVLADVNAATAADRDAFRHAETRAVEARRRHRAAPHRLDIGPRRQRRDPRREVHIAEQQLERAEDYLERTRQRTGPAVERHTRAVAHQRDAHDQLRNCDTIDLLDTMVPSVGEHRLHVRALRTWQRWAQGHDLPNGTVHTTFAVLAHQPGVEQQLATALRNNLRGTSIERASHGTAHIDLFRVHLAQPDFGIEL